MIIVFCICTVFALHLDCHVFALSCNLFYVVFISIGYALTLVKFLVGLYVNHVAYMMNKLILKMELSLTSEPCSRMIGI